MDNHIHGAPGQDDRGGVAGAGHFLWFAYFNDTEAHAAVHLGKFCFLRRDTLTLIKMDDGGLAGSEEDHEERKQVEFHSCAFNCR